MSKRLLPLAAALCLVAAQPAAAMHMDPTIMVPATAVQEVFVAYGTGATTCQITVAKKTGWLYATDLDAYGTMIKGVTDCSSPVAQTGHATVPASGSIPAIDGGLCSTTSAVCTSARTLGSYMNPQPVTYRMSLRAPLGQGWIGAPTNCSGVGTDNLSCTFTLQDVTIGGPLK